MLRNWPSLASCRLFSRLFCAAFRPLGLPVDRRIIGGERGSPKSLRAVLQEYLPMRFSSLWDVRVMS
eukprot:8507377-Pyramimonas_sp.AAC.1